MSHPAPPPGPWATVPGQPRVLDDAGRALYRAGDPARSVYLVEAGCLKSVTFDADGDEHVRAFHFPGELVGLDALGAEAFPSSAITVTPAIVRRLSLDAVIKQAHSEPALLRDLLDRTGDHLRRALAWGGDYRAEERVAAFLLTMQVRLGNGAALRLPMPRRDIANHLRLATETVCRVLRRFESRGWLAGSNRSLRLEQPVALRRLAAGLDALPALKVSEPAAA